MSRRVKVRRSRHRRDCLHCPRVRQLGHDFQAHRAAWETQLEAETYGYAEEERQYREAHPAPTFKAYLVALAGSGWPMSGRVA